MEKQLGWRGGSPLPSLSFIQNLIVVAGDFFIWVHYYFGLSVIINDWCSCVPHFNQGQRFQIHSSGKEGFTNQLPFLFFLTGRCGQGKRDFFASRAYKALRLGFQEESLGWSFPSFIPHSLLPAIHPQ